MLLVRSVIFGYLQHFNFKVLLLSQGELLELFVDSKFVDFNHNVSMYKKI